MGTITTGIGLISGIDTANLIEQLLALASRPKVALQGRVATLQSQKAALLDINSRLLSFKNLARGLRVNNVFTAATATSSDPSILTATASAAQPGSFKFIVKQLVSTSQQLSKGFFDSTSTPVGIASLSFELGNGRVSTSTDLADLNGGTGVRRGKIVITDSDSKTATINLSSATTINEVLKAINEDTTIKVTAAVVGDHLTVTDNAGGGGALTITDATGDFTATDLGIAGSEAGGTITGTDINLLGSVTAIDSLNDGTGVYITEGNDDLTITARDETIIGIDLGRIDTLIEGATLIKDLNDGAGITLNGNSNPDIRFVARDGTNYDVDLDGITTVQDFMDRVASASSDVITITIDPANKFIVNDTNPSGLLKIQGIGVNGTKTANDFGILNEAGVDAPSYTGTLIQNADHTPATRTIQEVIDRINNDADNGGRITASIVPEPEPNANVSLRIKDNTGGMLSNLIIASTFANPYAARDLGIEADVAADTFDGSRLIAGINSVLVASLNGGAGLSGNNSLTINDRSGGSDTFALNEDGSLSEIIDLINNSGAINITASLNNSGNGLLITDTVGGGGNLTISGTAASELGIAADVAADSVRGTSLQLRYVAEGSALTGLNYGRGIGTGEFRITDGDGRIATVKIGSDAISLYDIIREINGQASAASPPLSINARVNDNGDGLLIENTGGSGIIRVDTINGTTAADLGIVGQAASDGADIDGSFEKTVTVNKADTLSEIVSAINDAGIPVTASILNTGAGPTPFQISFSSLISGTPGALVIDAKDDTGAVFDLGLTTISQGQNAKVFFGSNDPAQGVLIERSSNTLTDVLSGVTLDLVSASSTPVTLTVTRDTSGITEKVAEFVDAFNDVIARIDQYDFFDVETETRGPLLGNTTTAQVRNALFNIVNRTTTGVTTKFTRLSEVGIRIGSDSNLVFDQAKFQAAYQDDPIAVENLFAALKSTTTTTQQIAPGVTITKNETTFSQLGFGDLFDQLLDNLTNSIDGTLTIADESLQDKIDLTTKRIEEFDERIQIQRERMQREFTAMETALALLQNQSNALLSLVGNLTFAQNLFSNTVRR